MITVVSIPSKVPFNWGVAVSNAIEAVRVAQEAGPDGGNALEISAEELAGLCDTINYEVICSPGKRVPKRYVAGGQTVSVMNVLIG